MEVASLPAFDLTTDRPLQTQIHERMVSWISQGRLLPGVRLPSTRKLSEALGVSRNTVSAVIDQLKAEGFIDSHVGRGSFIAIDIPVIKLETLMTAAPAEHGQPELSNFGAMLLPGKTRHTIASLPFTPGVPDLKQFPHAIWQKLWRRHQDRTSLMGYDNDQGYAPLREALATYLRVSRGVRCTAQQILITQGAQQGLSLCAQMLVNPGDTILHENPGYTGASGAFLVQQPKLIHLPLKNGVVDVDWIIQHHSKTSAAKLMYSSPTHQYPMGGLLTASQRLLLLNWIHENRVWLIEDDYDSEFHFIHKPVAAMQGMTQTINVIYMGSFSKTLLPALRLGYLVLPEHLVGAFAAAKSFLTGESSIIPQAVVADFIAEGHFVRHLRRMRQLYKTKWQHFGNLLQASLADRVTVIAESAGMHLVVEIPNCNDVALKQTLQEKGFGSSALSTYYLGDKHKTGLVLGFANTTQSQRVALVETLAELIG